MGPPSLKSTLRRVTGRVWRWNGVVGLAYHRIGDGRRSVFDRGLWSATEADFERQVAWLKVDFDAIGPNALQDALRERRGRYVLITFDDGYLDNYTVAYPILRTHRIPATFFVTTGFIDNPQVSWWDEIAWMVRTTPRSHIALPDYLQEAVVCDEPDRERAVRTLLRRYKSLPAASTSSYLSAIRTATGTEHVGQSDGNSWMTWDMIREMHAGGMTIGGHSVSHPVLSRMSRDDQWLEISGCTRRIEEELGAETRTFSYPVGGRDSFNDHTRSCLAEAGVRTAFSYYGGYRRFADWDDYDVPRAAVEQDTTFGEFRSMLAFPGL